MKAILLFLIFLLVIEPNHSFKNGKAKLDSSETLSDDELINFPLKELQGDCDDLEFFSDLVVDSIKQKKCNLDKLKSAQTSISDAKVLVFKILNVETKLLKKEGSNCFVQKSLKRDFSAKNNLDGSQTVLNQMKDDFSDLVDKLQEVYELVTSSCKNDMKDINRILNSITPGEHSQNIVKCKNMLKILDDINSILNSGTDKIGGVITKLNAKKTQAELLISKCQSGCS